MTVIFVFLTKTMFQLSSSLLFFFARTTLKNIWQSVDLTAAMEKVSESYVLVCEQAFEVLDSTSLCCVPVFQLWRLSI